MSCVFKQESPIGFKTVRQRRLRWRSSFHWWCWRWQWRSWWRGVVLLLRTNLSGVVFEQRSLTQRLMAVRWTRCLMRKTVRGLGLNPVPDSRTTTKHQRRTIRSPGTSHGQCTASTTTMAVHRCMLHRPRQRVPFGDFSRGKWVEFSREGAFEGDFIPWVRSF